MHPDALASHRAAPRLRRRYATGVPLAEGGTADVYRAYDATLGREVALKYLRHKRPALVARLLREARALARLQHPGICEVYQVGESEGRPYVARRLVDGDELNVALAGAPWRTIVRVLRAAADGVAAAHAAGLVHRDLKPSNILVEVDADDGALRPVVVDFGIVHDLQRGSGTLLTEAGQLLGTVQYMAPEQLRGTPDAIGPQADVWALGITLAQLLSADGRTPFRADSQIGLMRAVLRATPQLPDVGPPALRAVLRRCLAKRPGDRYRDARALVDDLDRVLDDRPIAPRSAGMRLRSALEPLRRHPLVAISALLLLIALGLALGLELRHREHLQQRRDRDQRMPTQRLQRRPQAPAGRPR
ncbi:MAG: serine/threonine-protein kinase, partial [Acidobacteriota bacterium]